MLTNLVSQGQGIAKVFFNSYPSSIFLYHNVSMYTTLYVLTKTIGAV